MKHKVKILSITRNDCDWTYSKSGGPGGQHRNKTATAVTVRHPPSGAVGHAADSKSQWQNRQMAWRRMAESPEMKFWLRMQAGYSLVTEAEIEAEVRAMMAPENLQIETKQDGRWVPDSG